MHSEVMFECTRPSSFFPSLRQPRDPAFTITDGHFLVTPQFASFPEAAAMEAIDRVVLGGWPFLTAARIVAFHPRGGTFAHASLLERGIDAGESSGFVDISFLCYADPWRTRLRWSPPNQFPLSLLLPFDAADVLPTVAPKSAVQGLGYVRSLGTMARVIRETDGHVVVRPLPDPLTRADRLLLKEGNAWTLISDIATRSGVTTDALMAALTVRRDGLSLPVFRWNGIDYDGVPGAAIKPGRVVAVHRDVAEAMNGYFAKATGLRETLRREGFSGFNMWALKTSEGILAGVRAYVTKYDFGERFARLASAAVGRSAINAFEARRLTKMGLGAEVVVEEKDITVCRGARRDRELVRPGDRIVALAGAVEFGTMGSVVEIANVGGRTKLWAIADRVIPYGTRLTGRLKTPRGFSLMEDEVEVVYGD
jgi:hypothetical protein